MQADAFLGIIALEDTALIDSRKVELVAVAHLESGVSKRLQDVAFTADRFATGFGPTELAPSFSDLSLSRCCAEWSIHGDC